MLSERFEPIIKNHCFFVSNYHYLTFCTHMSSLTIMFWGFFWLVEQIIKSQHHWLTPRPDRIAIKVLCDDLSPGGQVPNVVGVIQRMNHMMHF